MQFMFLSKKNFSLLTCDTNFYEFISQISGKMNAGQTLPFLTSGFEVQQFTTQLYKVMRFL